MNPHENARPGISVEAEGLVEPEGVNAGSAESTVESAAGAPANRPTADLRRGGRPADAAEQAGWAPGRDQVVVSPWAHLDPGAPSLEQSAEEERFRRG